MERCAGCFLCFGLKQTLLNHTVVQGSGAGPRTVDICTLILHSPVGTVIRAGPMKYVIRKAPDIPGASACVIQRAVSVIHTVGKLSFIDRPAVRGIERSLPCGSALFHLAVVGHVAVPGQNPDRTGVELQRQRAIFVGRHACSTFAALQESLRHDHTDIEGRCHTQHHNQCKGQTLADQPPEYRIVVLPASRTDIQQLGKEFPNPEQYPRFEERRRGPHTQLDPQRHDLRASRIEQDIKQISDGPHLPVLLCKH